MQVGSQNKAKLLFEFRILTLGVMLPSLLHACTRAVPSGLKYLSLPTFKDVKVGQRIVSTSWFLRLAPFVGVHDSKTNASKAHSSDTDPPTLGWRVGHLGGLTSLSLSQHLENGGGVGHGRHGKGVPAICPTGTPYTPLPQILDLLSADLCPGLLSLDRVFMRQQAQRLHAFMLCTSFPEISWTRMRLPCLPS